MESKINARNRVSDAKQILYRVVVFVGLLVLISFLLEGCTQKENNHRTIITKVVTSSVNSVISTE